MKIDLNDMERNMSEFQQQNEGMGLIINPVLQKFDLLEKEKIEVCQIGKFLYKIDPKLRIIDKPSPPSPDFILSIDNRIIGLEHTRLIDKINAQKYFSISRLFNDAAKEFQINNPDKKINAIFKVKNDKLEYKQRNKNSLIEEINRYVIEFINDNFENKPEYIKEIKIIDNSNVTFTYIEDDFHAKKLTISELKNAISIKEEKLKKYYRQSSSIEEFWLVLMIGSLNSASFELNDNLNYKMNSVFDKVFLMTDFKEKIIQVK